MNYAVDLFAGFGGNTIGAKEAGLEVVWAANHNQMAVSYHSLMHPEVVHSCQDLQQADWGSLPKHDVLMASPCCQGHTRARGKEGPHHHKSRSTAWAPLSCAEYHSPDLIFIENVPELINWKLFKHWHDSFNSLGYSLSINLLDAADYGVAQQRKRVYIIGTKSKHPLELNIKPEPHVSCLSILDLDSGKWSLINKKGRAKSTLTRVDNGRKQFGDLFVMPYYSSGSGRTGRDVNRPIGTVTTKDRWAIVKGDMMRMLTVDEYRKAMSFPENTILPKRKDYAVQLLGNATCPLKVKKILDYVLKAA